MKITKRTSIVKKNRLFKIVLLTAFIFNFALANDTDLASIFEKTKITGTIVISSLNNEKTYIYNTKRAFKQYIPASTFKIPNTLIALQEKAIKDEYELIKWDAIEREYNSWNKDQTLQSAISSSCIWYYQKIARKVGNKKYLKYLNQLQYGNQQTGEDVETFWLVGNLKISAMQQIEFLKKLYNNKLPFNQEHIDTTKKVLVIHQTQQYTLRAKSGFSGKIGWFVGYVEKKDQVYFFALNANVTKDTMKYRKQIVLEALKIKNII